MERAAKRTPRQKAAPTEQSAAILRDLVVAALDDAKAEEIVTIDLAGKSSLGDFMVVATGRSDRHVAAIADQVAEKVAATGLPNPRTEGLPQADWVVIDAGAVIVHVFRPEVREFYKLEKMWQADRPAEQALA